MAIVALSVVGSSEPAEVPDRRAPESGSPVRGPAMTWPGRRGPSVVALATLTGCVVVLANLPGSRWVVPALGLCAVGGLLWTSLNPPRNSLGSTRGRDPWALMAGGLLALVVSASLRPASGSAAMTFPGPTDVAAVLAYPCIIWGLLGLTQARVLERSSDTLLAAAIWPLACGLVAWIVMADHLARSGSSTRLVTAAGVVLLVGDGVVLALAVRLHFLLVPRSAGYRYLSLGFCCLLAAHLSRTAGTLLGHDSRLGARALFVLAYGLTTLAALTIGRERRAEHGPVTHAAMGRGRVLLVFTVLLVGPLVVLQQYVDHGGWVPLALAVSAGLSLLVALHLVRLLQDRSRLEHHVLHDGLTGLANRTLFHDRLGHALAARPADESLAVMFLDLDRFKKINDSLGHAPGNELLCAVADRLRGAVRDGDVVARLAGDEFAVLLPSVDDESAAVAIAQRLLAAFTDPFQLDGHTVFVTSSVGIALAPGHGDNAETILKSADAAMYRAKEHGRNTYRVFCTDMRTQAHQRLALETSLHTAIERDELTLHYQPKVDLRSGLVVGMEALVRWEHPELGTIPPMAFIGVAEETGLIVPLGELVLEKACAQTRAWQDEGLPPLTVAVNLSARQFRQQNRDVSDLVAGVLRRTGLEPGRLELELTESLALEDPDHVVRVLEDLKSVGVKCSVDDFGTGYSALNYLTRFPIDKLKIDKSFVTRIATSDKNDAAVILAVIAMAHSLGLEVVAEGVETHEQLRFLRDHGCDVMQGYLFSPPLPAEDFARMLRSVGPAHQAADPAPILRPPSPSTPSRAIPTPAQDAPIGQRLWELGATPAGSEPAEAPGSAAAAAAVAQREPRRRGTIKAGVAAAVTVVSVSSFGLASAGALPGPVQAVAARLLAPLAVSPPTSAVRHSAGASTPTRAATVGGTAGAVTRPKAGAPPQPSGPGRSGPGLAGPSAASTPARPPSAPASIHSRQAGQPGGPNR